MESLGKKICKQLDENRLTPYFSLTTASPLFFKENNNPEGIGSFMLLYEKTRKQAYVHSFLDEIDNEDNIDKLIDARISIYKGKYQTAINYASSKFQRDNPIDKIWALFVRDQVLTALGKFDEKRELEKLINKENSKDKNNYTLQLQVLRNLVDVKINKEAQLLIEELNSKSLSPHDPFSI